MVLAFHIPLELEGESFRLEDRQRLFSILKEYPNTLAPVSYTHLDVYKSQS